MVEVVEHRGSVASLHARDPFVDGAVAAASVWWCRFDDAAIVLGSRQRPSMLDAAAVDADGLTIARRRSGGGAVVLRPGEMVWIDLVLPAGVAPHDVRGSMIWAGECWRDALASIGPGASRATVHRGGMVETPWSDLVCFAGVGPGEVLLSGRKLVGLSQRRTRHGVRVQGLVHRRARVETMASLFVGPAPTEPVAPAAELAEIDGGDLADDAVVAALASVVTRRITPV